MSGQTFPRKASPLREHFRKRQDTITVLLSPHGSANPYKFNITKRLFLFIQIGIIFLFFLSIAAIALHIKESFKKEKISAVEQVWQNKMQLAHIYRHQLENSSEVLYEKGQELCLHVWGKEASVGLNEVGDNTFMKTRFNNNLIPLRTSLGFLMTRESVFKAMPIGMPLDNAYVSSLYGERISPFGNIPQFHTGMDFANAIGTPIKVTADGTVIGVTPVNGPGLGIHVKVLHKHGFMTVYGHMSELKVEKDQVLKRGDVVGLLGQTGMATGPHLHYEVHLRYVTPNGPYSTLFDPWLFVKEEL